MTSFISSLIEKVRRAKRVYVIGNGGSYANAQHIVNDLIKRGIKAHTIEPACLSMLANDEGWENALAWWVSTVGEQGDLLIAMSGSGKSPNILKAVTTARFVGLEVHTEYGYPKGLDMQKAEEAQIKMGHDLYRALK